MIKKCILTVATNELRRILNEFTLITNKYGKYMAKISGKMLFLKMACGENEIWSQESLFCHKLRMVVQLPSISEIQNFLFAEIDCIKVQEKIIKTPFLGVF